MNEKNYNNRNNMQEIEEKVMLHQCSECKNFFLKEDMNNNKCKECESEYNHEYYLANKERIKEKNSSDERKKQRAEAVKKFNESYKGGFLYFYTISLKDTEFEMCIYTGEDTNVYSRHHTHLSLKNKDGVAYKVKQMYGLDKNSIKGYVLDLTKYNLTTKQRKLLEQYMILWFKANGHCLLNDKKVKKYFTEEEMIEFKEIMELLEVDYLHPKHFIPIEQLIDVKKPRKKYKKRR